MAEGSQRKLKITKQQEMFCRYYAQNGHNGSAAAIAAGYSKKYARTIACLNLKKPNVSEFLNELEKPVLEKLGVTINWVIAILKSYCEANITDFYDRDPKTNKYHLKDLKKLPRELTGAIEFMEPTKNGVTIKLVDKKVCVINIGKYLGMFKEQYGLNINNNLTNIDVDFPTFDSIEHAD